MPTGDPMATCPLCGISYYLVHGHGCAMSRPVRYYEPPGLPLDFSSPIWQPPTLVVSDLLNQQAAAASGNPQHDCDCPARCRTHECHKPPGKCTCPLGSAREVRTAAVELLAVLPKCDCGKVATWSSPGAPDFDTGRRDDPEMLCDEHKGEGCGNPSGCCKPTELPWATAARAMMRALEVPRT